MSALYGIAYSEAALKALEGIPRRFRAQIVKKVKRLADDPKPPGCRKVMGAVHGDDLVYRIRSGDYRALYSVRENPSQVVVLDIGHRKDVYR